MKTDAPVLIDFESRSRADLRRIGGRLYWEDPTTEAIVAVWFDTRDESVGVWRPGEPWPHKGRVLAAHNALGFDQFGARKYRFAAGGWIDTMNLARKAGLPGSLDALATALLGIPKDSEGSKLTRSLSTIRRPPKAEGDRYITTAAWAALDDKAKRDLGIQRPMTPEIVSRVTEYCLSDVLILAATWPELSELQAVDRDVEAVDAIINDRGIAFDRDLAHRLLAEDDRVAADALAEAAAELGWTTDKVKAAAMSPVKFTAVTGAPNAQAATVATIDHPLAPARMALASIARGKLRAGLSRVSGDGRLRDSMLYYGAHTGRWSGRGFQPHNLPRPAKRFEDVDPDALGAEVLAGRPCSQDEIEFLLRGVLTATPGNMLAVADFASIEARATAWAAEDGQALDVFRSGLDPYRVAATSVFGVTYDEVTSAQRQIGKVCELALGYQGGPNAFASMARNYGIDLSALDLDAIVKAWRQLHAPITALWHRCERAFGRALEGGKAHAGPFEFLLSDEGDAVACFLPSGRPIIYNSPRMARRKISDRIGLEYQSGSKWVHIYGGKLVENAVQGFCRDLMADALVAAERADLRPVLHVHDEIVCDVPERDASEAYDRLVAIMTRVPTWAVGMPIEAKGWTGFRYRK